MPQYLRFKIKNWLNRILDSFAKSSSKKFGIKIRNKDVEKVMSERARTGSSFPVHLRLYDLPLHGNDIFLTMTKRVLGLETIYHTSVVVYGIENAHNPIHSSGITSCLPDGPGRKIPIQKIDVGFTEIEPDVFKQWIAEVANEKFAATNYSLLHNNCNHFTQDAMLFLGIILV